MEVSFHRFAGACHVWVDDIPEGFAVTPVGTVVTYCRWSSPPMSASDRAAMWGYKVGFGGHGEYGVLGGHFEHHQHPYLAITVHASIAAAARACLVSAGVWGWEGRGVVRAAVLSDEAWALIEGLMPVTSAKGGRPWADHRRVVEGIIWRYRTGTAWRDLPGEFGPWQTVWRRHRQFAQDGTWDRIHAALLTRADAAGLIDWRVSIDSTINRAHQHATNITRVTGGGIELQESAHRA